MIEDQVIIVIGSNSGIGKATAKAIAEMGATVVRARKYGR